MEVLGMFGRHPVAGARRHHSPGFWLIEVLIAMALAGLLLIGVLPLFTKAMWNNGEGNQLTEVTNRARLHVEELTALPVDAEELTVPNGEDALVTIEMY